MMILIAGPYRSGTNDDPALIKKNVQDMESYALPIFRAGQLVYEAPSIEASRERVRKQLSCAPPEILQLKDPTPYKMGLERSLHELRSKLITRVRQQLK